MFHNHRGIMGFPQQLDGFVYLHYSSFNFMDSSNKTWMIWGKLFGWLILDHPPGVHAATRKPLAPFQQHVRSRGWMMSRLQKVKTCKKQNVDIPMQSTNTLSNTRKSGPKIPNRWAQLELGAISKPFQIGSLNRPRSSQRGCYSIKLRVPYRRTWNNMTLITPVVESNKWLWWQEATLLFWSALANIPSSVFPAML